MQLVYLWIKDYKNIKELGIPLEISYNESEKTAYTSSKESITIKLSTTGNYNVFGDNLNIKTLLVLMVVENPILQRLFVLS